MKRWFPSNGAAEFFFRHWGKLLGVLVIIAFVVVGFLLSSGNGSRFTSWWRGATAELSGEPTIWTCAMHPQVRETHPGQCPICRMDLTPVAKWSENANPTDMQMMSHVPGRATVMIPGEFQQRIGVRTGVVELGPLRMSIEAVGIVQPDETLIARVNIKTEGWVEKLFVNFVGQKVHKGDPLLSIYSPQFLSTQEELLASLRAEKTLGGSQEPLSEAARRRLEL